ncbi:MAG: hypothetical protein CLLPBCKN_007056 [Chroococcidiopsis cubana SAG 39.79]|nr:hypothetical protein [Chroococcidiopsis cubana SAG 39.79]
MFNVSTAQQSAISSLRLGFTGSLKVIWRAIGGFQETPPEQLPFFTPSQFRKF